MTQATNNQPDGTRRPWHREPYVWLLILIPGAAVIMGVVMISLAVVSDDGLVVDDYYKRGMEINRSIARDEAARRYGLSAILDLDAVLGTINLKLVHGMEFQPPPVLSFGLYHSTRSGYDQVLSLKRSGSGYYDGRVPTLVPGKWNFQIEADDWRLNGTLKVPGDQQVHVEAPS